MSENMLEHKYLMFMFVPLHFANKPIGSWSKYGDQNEMKFNSSVFHLSTVQYLWLIYAEFEKRNNPMRNSLCCH